MLHILRRMYSNCQKLRINSKLISTITLGILSTVSNADDPARLAYDFCYAVSTQSVCDSYQMRAETEKKVENQAGSKVRGPESPFNEDCMKGLLQAMNDEADSSYCNNAWNMYGCNGNVRPRLLQKNSFKNDNDILCKY